MDPHESIHKLRHAEEIPQCFFFFNWWQPEYKTEVVLGLILGQSQDRRRETVSIPETRRDENTNKSSYLILNEFIVNGLFHTFLALYTN